MKLTIPTTWTSSHSNGGIAKAVGSAQPSHHGVLLPCGNAPRGEILSQKSLMGSKAKVASKATAKAAYASNDTTGFCASSASAPPIVSLSAPDAADRISAACSTWGALVAVDHGVPDALLTDVLSLGHRFFDLPLETKERYALQKHGAKWRGYMPLYGERSVRGSLVDHKEGMYLGDDHDPSDPRVLAGLPTFGTNVYPDGEIPEMRKTFEDYHGRMRGLGDRMMGLLSVGLGLEEDRLERTVTRGEPVVLPRMFRYPPRQRKEETDAKVDGCDDRSSADDADEKEQWGIGRHSDYGLWTMILTDAPGLEFQHPKDGTWHAVPFVPGGIVMNVGDVLDRLTAGKLVSAYHRARNLSDAEPRLSLPFFYDPAWDARMETLPIADAGVYDTPEREARWSQTKITCSFDVSSESGMARGVEYSEFLAKKVAKVFPDLVPESTWKTLSSTSAPSTRHALTVDVPDKVYTDRVLTELRAFYAAHPHIKESHGLSHATAVRSHAIRAIACASPPLSATEAMEVQVAALLHDVDDRKYFPPSSPQSVSSSLAENSDKENSEVSSCSPLMPNARRICAKAGITADSLERIVTMIQWVGCSENGNSVPPEVKSSGAYHLLIPRWSDRLEAVGAVGVVRCYQYNQEKGRPLCSDASPRPTSADEVFELATPDRFEAYLTNGGRSEDMISHYYDKLLHIARPPPAIVRNAYLESNAEESARELVEVCLRFGRTGVVDEEYIKELQEGMKDKTSM